MKIFRCFGYLNKNLGIFYVASLSILLLASTVAIPLQSYAEKPDNAKTPVVILFNDKVSRDKLDLVRSSGGEITRTYTIINGLAANLPPQAIENLKNNPSVITVDPDIEFHALELDANNRIGADQVWSNSASQSPGNGVIVAVLDTGIDTDNAEFTGRILDCHSQIAYEPDCEDGHGHGTHAAGIAGATGIVSESPSHCNSDDDSTCAKGVAYGVSFYIDKVLDSSGSGSLSGIISGIDRAVYPPLEEPPRPRANVISMSLGTNPYYDQNADHCDLWYQSMTNAVNAAFAEGVTVVAAAGNDGAAGVGLPACIRNTIAVAAVDDNDNIAGFSSIGGAVRHHGISAPGVGIYSSLPGNTYSSWSGTSMATPVVAGTVALLLEEDPTLSAYAVKNVLFDTACTMSTCSETPSIPDSSNITYGHGRVNAIAAYNSILGTPPPESPDADGDNYTVAQGDCNDNDASINPGAADLVDDNIDQNCNGEYNRQIQVHDLSASTSGKKNMNVQVTLTILDSSDNTPVEYVTVPYEWTGDSSGSSSCVTNSDGQCTVSKNTKGNTLILTVGTLSMNTEYVIGVNHDHESDSDGDSITVERGEGNNPGGDDPGGNDGEWDCVNKPHPKKCPPPDPEP